MGGPSRRADALRVNRSLCNDCLGNRGGPRYERSAIESLADASRDISLPSSSSNLRLLVKRATNELVGQSGTVTSVEVEHTLRQHLVMAGGLKA